MLHSGGRSPLVLRNHLSPGRALQSSEHSVKTEESHDLILSSTDRMADWEANVAVVNPTSVNPCNQADNLSSIHNTESDQGVKENPCFSNIDNWYPHSATDNP